MPIVIGSGEIVRTATNTILNGVNSASVAFWLRLDSAAFADTRNIFLKDTSSVFFITKIANTNNTIRARWKHSNGVAGGVMEGNVNIGQWHHIAFTQATGIQRLYIDGIVRATDANVSGLQDAGARRFDIGHTTHVAADYAVDDAAVWAGYELTGNDVLTLVSGAPPTGLTPLPAWSVGLNGTNGAAVVAGDAGLVDEISGVNLTTVTGPMTWDGTEAALVPSIRIRDAFVGKSGKSIGIVFENGLSNLITAQTGYPTVLPTISVDSGVHTPLLSGIFQADEPYALFYWPTGQINPGQNVRFSAAQGWASNSSYQLADVVTNQSVTNYAGVETLSSAKSTGIMQVGYNFPALSYFTPFQVYTNLFKQANDWIFSNPTGSTVDGNGNITAMPAGTASALVTSVGAGGLGYKAAPTGVWSLFWDGVGGVELTNNATGNVTLTLLTQSTGNLLNNKIDYLVSGVAQVKVAVRVNSLPVSGIRVNTDDQDSSKKFNSNLTRILAAARCIRFMDSHGTNACNIVNFSDFNTESRASYFAQRKDLLNEVAVSSVTAFNNSGLWFEPSNYVYVTVNCSGNHNFIDGHTATLANNSPINANGSGFTIDIDGTKSVKVISPTSFAIQVFQTNGGTVDGTQTPSGSVSMVLRPGMPIVDMCELVNLVPSCNMWFCVPHAATDNCVAGIGSTIAKTLRKGRRLYLELSNEHWNTSTAFTQHEYFFGKGQHEPSITGAFPDPFDANSAYYGQRSAEVLNIVRQEFHKYNRKNEVKLVLAGQLANSGVLLDALSRITSLGSGCHAIAVAPYWGNNTTVANVNWTNQMDVSGLHDLSYLAANYPYDFQDDFTRHKQIAQRYNVDLMCYEGGPQTFALGSTTSAALSRNAGRDPRMYYLNLQYLRLFESYNVKLFNHYVLFGVNEDVSPDTENSNWNAFYSFNQAIGRGDGSDGRFNNASNYNDVYNVVSVIGQSYFDWGSSVHDTSFHYIRESGVLGQATTGVNKVGRSQKSLGQVTYENVDLDQKYKNRFKNR